MLTFNHKVAYEFNKLLDAAVARGTESIVSGQLPHEVYKSMTGEIRGLNLARELLDEAIAICEGKRG
jgi:hypothetical protein